MAVDGYWLQAAIEQDRPLQAATGYGGLLDTGFSGHYYRLQATCQQTGQLHGTNRLQQPTAGPNKPRPSTTIGIQAAERESRPSTSRTSCPPLDILYSSTNL